MKKAILFVCFATCFVFGLSAQTDSTKLLQAKRFESDGFVQAGFMVQQFNNKSGFLAEFSLNWVVEKRFMLGAVFRQLASFEEINTLQLPPNTATADLSHQAAGLRFGYLVFHDKVVSLNPSVTALWANMVYEPTEGQILRHNFAMLTPSVSAVYNASDIVRVGAGLYYNQSISADLPLVDDAMLSGVGGRFFVRVGRF